MVTSNFNFFDDLWPMHYTYQRELAATNKLISRGSNNFGNYIWAATRLTNAPKINYVKVMVVLDRFLFIALNVRTLRRVAESNELSKLDTK